MDIDGLHRKTGHCLDGRRDCVLDLFGNLGDRIAIAKHNIKVDHRAFILEGNAHTPCSALLSRHIHHTADPLDLNSCTGSHSSQHILGNVDAVYGMGKLCLETEPERAIQYFELAAKRGHTYAEYQLGKIFCFGIGVPRDLETGMEWLRLSAEHSNEHAASLLQHVKDHLAASATRSAFSLLEHLAQMIRYDGEHQYRVCLHTDSKLKSKIAEKKRLHGQKHQEEYQSMQL